MNTAKVRVACIGLTLGATACVSEGKYDDAVKSADDARQQCTASMAALQTQEKGWATRVDSLNATVQADQARLAAADAAEKDLLSKVDEKTVLAETLRRELQRTGENEVLYKNIAMRLKSVVDTGDLSIVLRGGRMVLRMPNDVLFDSGSVDIKPAGKKTLGFIASVLSTVPGRKFQVAGHTDTEPIHNARFASNWELSTQRAVEVVHFMVTSGGLKATLLSAAGYGEFDPVAGNAAAPDRAKNRRIEITLQPDIKEVVPVPDRY
ncbi:MAG: flagellar motor protein MotB [Polyangiaceae bacterium]